MFNFTLITASMSKSQKTFLVKMKKKRSVTFLPPIQLTISREHEKKVYYFPCKNIILNLHYIVMQLVPKVKVSVVYNIGPNILTMQSLIQKNNPFMIRFRRIFFGFAPLSKILSTPLTIYCSLKLCTEAYWLYILIGFLWISPISLEFCEWI